MILIKEVWKDIYDFPDKYEVSSFGRIRNKITNHIYKNTNKNGDYFRLNLYDKDNKRTCLIHREVAIAFIPNPNNYPEVNHKDLNKQNNNIDNLEWVTKKENVKHAIINNHFYFVGFDNKNRIYDKNCKNKINKKHGMIYQFTTDMKFIDKHNNSGCAYRKTGVCARNILHCANHKEGRTQAGGYIWNFAD